MRLSDPVVGVVVHRAGSSTIYHLNRNCRHLQRATQVVTVRRDALWPGFVCDTCRDEASCPACESRWPYCSCGGPDAG